MLLPLLVQPIRGEHGRVEGIFTAVTETTLRVLADRRTRLLRDLAAQSIEAKSTGEAYAIAADVLARNPHDVPFALLYTLGADGAGLTLAGQVGMPGASGHVAGDGDPWGLGRVAADERAVTLEGLDATMPGLPGGPWPEAVTQARVVPVTAGKGGRTSGGAVIGISPRLRFDERYQAFCEQVASNLSAAVTNALAYQEDRARAERLAELDRAKTAFFSNVSHEFRTPLTLMLSPLEEILAKPDGQVLPDDWALATVAHSNGLRLLRLVNAPLDFSRVEAGRARATCVTTHASFLASRPVAGSRSPGRPSGGTGRRLRAQREAPCECLSGGACGDRYRHAAGHHQGGRRKVARARGGAMMPRAPDRRDEDEADGSSPQRA